MGAKLKPIPFSHVAESGEEFAYVADVTVDQSGLFNVTLPPELEELADGLWRKRRDDGVDRASRLTRPQRALRVTAPDLALARAFVEALLREHLSCEVTRETVILYGSDTKVAYVKQPDGGIYANGGLVPPGTWRGDQWRGTLSGNNQAPFYSVGLAACVREKVTFRRASVTKVEWERVSEDGRPGVALLNSFTCLNVRPAGMREMPYTEEAAAFFHGTLMSIISLADRIDGFFGDEVAVQNAIAGRAHLALLGYDASAGEPADG